MPLQFTGTWYLLIVEYHSVSPLRPCFERAIMSNITRQRPDGCVFDVQQCCFLKCVKYAPSYS